MNTLPFSNQQTGQKFTLYIDWGWVVIPGQVWPWKMAGGNFRSWLRRFHEFWSTQFISIANIYQPIYGMCAQSGSPLDLAIPRASKTGLEAKLAAPL